MLVKDSRMLARTTIRRIARTVRTGSRINGQASRVLQLGPVSQHDAVTLVGYQLPQGLCQEWHEWVQQTQACVPDVYQYASRSLRSSDIYSLLIARQVEDLNWIGLNWMICECEDKRDVTLKSKLMQKSGSIHCSELNMSMSVCVCVQDLTLILAFDSSMYQSAYSSHKNS